MKMNNKILSIASAMALGLTISSCTEKQDWSTDSSTDRLFTALGDITITAEETKAYVEFKTVPNATHYIIEVSKDSLYDGIAQGASPTSVVYGADKSIVKSDTIRNLDNDTRYYLRMKSVSDSKESKWLYYKRSNGLGTFKTKAEQLFNDVPNSDRSENSIRLTWAKGAEVSAISVYKSDALADSILLNATAKANCEYTFTALTPSTSYKFFIWNGNVKRGELTVQTTAAMPAGDYKKILTAEETLISQKMLDELAAQAALDGKTSYGVTLGIPADATIEFHGVSEAGDNTNVKIPDGMSITFFGLAGGNAPTIKFQKNLDLAGSHGYIAFENVEVVDDGAGYFVNQSKECVIGEFTVKDAHIHKFKTSFFRFQGSDAKSLEKLTLTNSIFNDMCNGYSFIHVDAGSGAGHIDNIMIDGCTLYNIAVGGKMFIYSKNTNMQSISVKNTTFYNCIGNNNYWVDFGANTYGPSEKFEFVKCLFTKTPDEVTKNIRSSMAQSIDECYHTNDFFKTLGSTELEYSANELFADPDNGDFTLKKDINAGDPRWIVSE